MRTRFMVIAWLIVPVLAHAENQVLESATLPVRVIFSVSEQVLAERALAHVEAAWTRLVGDLGYPAPATGGTNGVPIRTGMDVWIAPTDMGAGGAMVEWQADNPATPQCDCTSRIILDSSTAADSPLVEEGMFHELVHACQYTVDCTEAPSVYESFAMAHVHLQFPDSANPPWMLGQFQRFPEYSLDYWSMVFPCTNQEPCFPYQLGAGLFPLFLIERVGLPDPGTLASLFARFAQHGQTRVGPPHPGCMSPNHPNWFEGVDAWLKEHGSNLDTAFAEFSAWRAIVGTHDDAHHFRRGAEYAEPPMARRVALQSMATTTVDAYEYGSRYIEFNQLDRAAAGPWRFRVAGHEAATWSASVLMWRSAQPVERVPVAMEGYVGSVVVPSISEVDRLVLVVSQLHDGQHNPDDMDHDNLRDVTVRAELESVDAGIPDAGTQADGAHGEGGEDAGTPGWEDNGNGDGGCGSCDAATPGWGMTLWLALAFMILGRRGFRTRGMRR